MNHHVLVVVKLHQFQQIMHRIIILIQLKGHNAEVLCHNMTWFGLPQKYTVKSALPFPISKTIPLVVSRARVRRSSIFLITFRLNKATNFPNRFPMSLFYHYCQPLTNRINLILYNNSKRYTFCCFRNTLFIHITIC